MTFSPLLAQGIAGILVAGLVGTFAYAFRTDAGALAAVHRIRSRHAWFRGGALLVVVGVVVVALAHAIATGAGIDTYREGLLPATRAAGYVLVAGGVAILDVLLWMPERALGSAEPAAA